MLEIKGNIWDHKEPNDIICVTTNGVVNRVGRLIMGKGIALQAAYGRWDLPDKWGKWVSEQGNTPCLLLEEKLLSFPTKNHWKDDSSLTLIEKSAIKSQKLAEENPTLRFWLPRPGCGNGNLNWEDVRAVIAPILSNSFTVVWNDGERI